MNSKKISPYYGWTVIKLKNELTNRGASTSGRKEDLIIRLEAYDRNQDFKGHSILLPEPLDPSWPDSGFHQLQLEHRILLSKLSRPQIDGYFKYREATDKHMTSDLKALQKGQLLYNSKKIRACSINVKGSDIYFTGIVSAAMRRNVTYSYKLKLKKENAEVLNSHCECPAGKGPHGTCKHLAAVLIMLSEFVSGSNPNVQRTCTEILQTFHRPKKHYSGTPLKAENLPWNRNLADLQDPRPPAFRNCAGYGDHVRNTVLNYCSRNSKDLAVRFIWNRADIRTAGNDHDYLSKPLLEQWVDNANHASQEQIISVERKTRTQADSPMWREQRLWRITASRFGEVCKLTARRNMNKLCKSFMISTNFYNKATTHGKQYEQVALKKFEAERGLSVQRCGLFIFQEKSYLACTPDGIISEDTIIEVKCPYGGRDSFIKPGKLFPFLEYDTKGDVVLKQTSNYYYQVQGQLYISKKIYCYFVVYTFKDILIQKVKIDNEYCEGSLMPKLTIFYEKYLRPYIADHY